MLSALEAMRRRLAATGRDEPFPGVSHYEGALRALHRMPRIARRVAPILQSTAGELIRYPYRPLPPELLERWAGRVVSSFVSELIEVGRPPEVLPPIIVATHRSALDILVLLSRTPGRFLARHDLADWLVVGPLARAAGTHFVERGNPDSGRAALRALRALVAQGERVILFPEGGTATGPSVGPLKGGALALARVTGAPLLPVGIAYPPSLEYGQSDFLQHCAGLMSVPPARVALVWGEACSAQETSSEALRQRLEALLGRAHQALEA